MGVKYQILRIPSGHAHFVDGWKLVAICSNEAAHQFSAGKMSEAEEPDAFVGGATLPCGTHWGTTYCSFAYSALASGWGCRGRRLSAGNEARPADNLFGAAGLHSAGR